MRAFLISGCTLYHVLPQCARQIARASAFVIFAIVLAFCTVLAFGLLNGDALNQEKGDEAGGMEVVGCL